MSTPLADQLKPLFQRLLTMAESHDERLARLEAAHSRLGTQMARVGEQLTRQSEQLSRLELPPAPVPVTSRPAAILEPGPGNRFGEQVGRLNEQITRVREQFGRMLDQLSRIEQAQSNLRDEAVHQGDEQRRLLEHVETTITRRQDELGEQLPVRIQRRMEEVLGIGVVEEGEDQAALEQPVETHATSSELAAVQDQVRQLGDRISELVGQLAKLASPAPAAKPAAVKPGVRPVPGTRQVSR